jgi:hypothetical protein
MLVAHFYTLSSSEFKKQILIIIAATAFAAGCSIWYVATRSSDLVSEILALYKVSNETDGLVVHYEKMKTEEERINKILADHKDFNIKTFFEKLSHDQQLSVEGSWEAETMPIPGSDAFEETRLPIMIKGQSIDKIVKLLNALEKEPMIDIKEVIMRHEGGALTLSLVLATKKHIIKSE